MNEQPFTEPREEHLWQIASGLAYPRTPELSRAVAARLMRPRRSVRVFHAVALGLVLVLAAVLAVPQARAQIAGYFRIGAVRIFPTRPTPTVTFTPAPLPTSTPEPTPSELVLRPSATSPVGTVTPEPGPEALRGLLGRTTLEDALRRATFPVLLPTYPADLGSPDYVFYQRTVPMVILAWSDSADPSQLRLSLYAIDSNSPMISKFQPEIVEEASVKGQYAVWAKGPYLLELTTQNFVLRRLVEGGTLIWQAGNVTYRLETGLPLEEAVKIAESLALLEPAKP